MNEELEALRAEATRTIEGQRKRLGRKCEAIRKDLARVAEAEETARLAALAVPTASSIPRGAAVVSVEDFATGVPVAREIPIDRTRPARDSLERIFRNARRLRLGAPTAAARLGEAEGALASLATARVEIAAATDEETIHALLARVLPRKATPAGAAPPQERKPPYRTFHTARGDVWVGRGALKNDELTFRVAKPYHLFLHVRGSPGAHVIVPVARGKVVSPEVLVDAAHLAAHFSDLRGESIVEVTYVPRKFVRKPRGAPPGSVTMEREKVLALRVDAARTEHLLGTEVG